MRFRVGEGSEFDFGTHIEQFETYEGSLKFSPDFENVNDITSSYSEYMNRIVPISSVSIPNLWRASAFRDDIRGTDFVLNCTASSTNLNQNLRSMLKSVSWEEHGRHEGL